MTGPTMPKPDEASITAFRALVPQDPRVGVRPMFGNLAAFVGGQMFMGLFGDDLFVRLDEANRERAIAAGGHPFAPMPGRTMREYVVLPDGWVDATDGVRPWIELALGYAGARPPKPDPAARRRGRREG